MITPEHFHLLDNVPIGVCVIDIEFNIVCWNRCIEGWTKISKSQAMGSALDRLIHHFHEPRYKSRIDSILAGGPPAIFSSQLHGQLFPSTLPNKKHLPSYHTELSISERCKKIRLQKLNIENQ